MVVVTAPSTEFSIATNAPAASPERTASSAAGTELSGTSSRVAASGSVCRAASVKVPSGPR